MLINHKFNNNNNIYYIIYYNINIYNINII